MNFEFFYIESPTCTETDVFYRFLLSINGSNTISYHIEIIIIFLTNYCSFLLICTR